MDKRSARNLVEALEHYVSGSAPERAELAAKLVQDLVTKRAVEFLDRNYKTAGIRDLEKLSSACEALVPDLKEEEKELAKKAKEAEKEKEARAAERIKKREELEAKLDKEESSALKESRARAKAREAAGLKKLEEDAKEKES